MNISMPARVNALRKNNRSVCGKRTRSTIDRTERKLSKVDFIFAEQLFQKRDKEFTGVTLIFADFIDNCIIAEKRDLKEIIRVVNCYIWMHASYF